jgi:putative membrane protein
MRLLGWLVKLGFFLLVLWFALKNTTPVPLHLTSTATWSEVPLIVIMIACVAVGALLGALSLAVPIYRIRRELIHLRRTHGAAIAEPMEGSVASAARRSGAVVEVGATAER